jgi:hypothetical protein
VPLPAGSSDPAGRSNLTDQADGTDQVNFPGGRVFACSAEFFAAGGVLCLKKFGARRFRDFPDFVFLRWHSYFKVSPIPVKILSCPFRFSAFNP